MPVRKRTTAANPRVPRRSACAGTASVEERETDIGRETPWVDQERKWPDASWAAASGQEDGSGIRLFFSCSSVVLQLAGRSSRWPQSSPARGPNPSTSAPELAWTLVNARGRAVRSRGIGQIPAGVNESHEVAAHAPAFGLRQLPTPRPGEYLATNSARLASRVRPFSLGTNIWPLLRQTMTADGDLPRVSPARPTPGGA